MAFSYLSDLPENKQPKVEEEHKYNDEHSPKNNVSDNL